MQEIMDKLVKDECIIGKVPNLLADEVSILFMAFNFYLRSLTFSTPGVLLKKIFAHGNNSVTASTLGSGNFKIERYYKNKLTTFLL